MNSFHPTDALRLANAHLEWSASCRWTSPFGTGAVVVGE